MSKEYPWGKGTPTWVRDAATNDSDKSFTVPAGKYWAMKTIHVYYQSTATVGNRLIRVRLKSNGTDIDAESVSNAHPASTNTRYNYSFVGNMSSQIAASAAVANFGESILPAGAVIQVLDTAAIDAAADDLTVVLHYVEYDA